MDQDQLPRGLDFARGVMDAMGAPAVLVDEFGHVVVANKMFYSAFRVSQAGVEQALLPQLIPSTPRALKRLSSALGRRRNFNGLEIEADLGRRGRRTFVAQGRQCQLPDSRNALLVILSEARMRRRTDTDPAPAQARIEKVLDRVESSLLASDELRRSRLELRDLAARLMTIQEDERRRVSRDLHDDFHQRLAMLEVTTERLGSHYIPSLELEGELRVLRTGFAEFSTEIRRVAYQLHPSILDHLGLAAALRSFCVEFEQRDGIRVTFRAPDDLERVPEAIALCFYRVAQESLRNIARHSGADTVLVKLAADRKAARLTIRDNGAGFEPANPLRKSGIGLLSMRERARLIDGELHVWSKVGHGTRIDIWAPLPEDDA